MYDRGCGVTVMEELSIHWRSLLAQVWYPPADRLNGAERAAMAVVFRVRRGAAS
ncbi:hypothetical protein HD596_008335 [Nonomuraea jabiensis]|uniref:Uncharacterized protein n=1 Tax=Nonomuraea jabiensis TaxID=882448 RepID=A0A7W9GD32_9ACTN|nr:hypothetical protein [Nonomuraea jabiensis]